MRATGTAYRFTIDDLARMNPRPLDDTRYEIIDGELHVSTQPHPFHQFTSAQFVHVLQTWSDTGGGITLTAPGVVFAPDDAAAPDVAWFQSRESFARAFGPDEKLHAADLVVEVLSPGRENERRDRELKLAMYSRWRVKEYWLADWRDRTVLVYRQGADGLALAAALGEDDALTSPLLPGFAVRVGGLFPNLELPAP
jgi:Uma2 family endonuclease